MHSTAPSVRARIVLAAALLVASIGSAATPAAAATPVTAGYRDFSYAVAAGADDATASTAQSKLWYQDGFWFGLLFDPGSASVSATFRIYRMNWATQDWTSTGVAVDDRNRSHADVLAVGNKLYVASSHKTLGVRFYSFTYNGTTHSYTKDAGYPKTLANTSTGTGYASIARDATGRLWIVFTQKSGTLNQASAYYASSGDGGATWTTPDVLPAEGSNTIFDEDIAAVSTVTTDAGSGVGVLWSDQDAGDEAFYFTAHLNGNAVGDWESRETAYGGSGTKGADNHISVKTDAAGNFLAAVKTAKGGAADPTIVALRRQASGTWEAHTVATHNFDVTRPVLVLNAVANRADVFVTSPTLDSTGAQSIYRRSASLTTLDFGTPARGTLTISNPTVDKAINDATSTKQLISRGWGELVVAADITTLRYLHAAIAAPDVDPLRQAFYVRSTAGSTALTKLAWSAADPWGIARYRLFYSLTSASGPWTEITLPSLVSTGISRSVSVGRQYWFLVRATDKKGVSSTRVTPLKVNRLEQTSASILYSGTWGTSLNSSASGGSLKYTTVLGASARYSFVGKSIGWVAWTGPGRGIARVYVDGALISTIDLRTSTNMARRVVFSRNWWSPGSHNIKIVLAGASGRQRMDLDAFLIGN